MAAKSVKKDVLTKLGLINDDQLEEILTDLDLTVSTEKRKKADAVFNAISRHLASDAVEDLEDDGLSIFLKVQTKLTEMLDEKVDSKSSTVGPTVEIDTPKTVPEVSGTKEEPVEKQKNPQPEMGATAVPGSMTRIEYHRLKDFRFEGGTVNGSLSYRNVHFQMEKGIELGHSQKEVMHGVIKAMKPGVLRTYCETSGTELKYDELCDLFQSCSGVENATLMLTRLNNSYQGDEFAEDKGGELEVDFVLRMGALRKTVLKLAKEEGAKLDEEMVSKSFRHALAVGIRRDIRLQVQSILTANEKIPDRELLKKVNFIMSMDKENQKTKGQNADVNPLNYLDNGQRQYTPRQQQYSQRPQHYPQRPPQYPQRPQQFPQQQEQFLPQPTEQKYVQNMLTPKSDYNDRTDALINEMQMMNKTMVEMKDVRKKEMDEMRGHIRKLEQRFDDRDRSMGMQNNNRRRDPVKCKNCKDQNLPRCTHCVKCLEEGHKQDQCTKN